MLGVFLVIFLIGLCVLLYPSVSNYINEKNASRVINIYEENLTALSAADYSAYLEAARDYNTRLAQSGLTVTDAFASGEKDEDRSSDYWTLLDLDGSGVMGYIVIDKIQVKLPLYHGTDEAVLQVGAGHIQGSSLPVGGESTHAVMSAHTGLPSAEYFTDLDQLVLGDTFVLRIFGETLTYRVDQILTVLPHETEALSITPGQDYATLITCTPYGVNSHRLLVRGTRAENAEAQTPEVSAGPSPEPTVPAEPTGFEKAKNQVVKVFAAGFETLATWLVTVSEWGMDRLGIEY